MGQWATLAYYKLNSQTNDTLWEICLGFRLEAKMIIEDEIYSLAAVNMALQSLFAELCIGLIAKDPSNRYIVSKVFDHAANHVENVAIMFEKSANPKQSVKALRVVEELRTIVLGDEIKPKGGV
jgi:hypothetical protein